MERKTRYTKKDWNGQFRDPQAVVNQIQHDDSFSVSNFCIWYVDRFFGEDSLLSKPLTEFIAESKLVGETETVPWHRIREIRDSEGEIWYDRKRRIDRFKRPDRS